MEWHVLVRANGREPVCEEDYPGQRCVQIYDSLDAAMPDAVRVGAVVERCPDKPSLQRLLVRGQQLGATHIRVLRPPSGAKRPPARTTIQEAIADLGPKAP